MKILSINVNNFGGNSAKPLLKDYKIIDINSDGKKELIDYKSWQISVDKWRDDNKDCIKKNVKEIANLINSYDISFLYEVDTNCESWYTLLRLTDLKFIWKPAKGINKNEYKKNKKSISCVFIKKGIEFKYDENSIFENQHRNIEIIVGDTHIIGLHMSYYIEDWNRLISKYESLKNNKFLIIGDLNVFDVGTERRKKFDELIKKGAIDIWLKQGCCNNIPTANTNKRIDYALATPELYKCGIKEKIYDDVRQKNFTDHAAIEVVYAD